MLLQDRHDLVDQGFDVIVARIVARLLQFAHEFFVIGAGLPEKDPIELGAIRGGQFLVHRRPVSLVALRRSIAQTRAAVTATAEGACPV